MGMGGQNKKHKRQKLFRWTKQERKIKCEGGWRRKRESGRRNYNGLWAMWKKKKSTMSLSSIAISASSDSGLWRRL
jgi:hypothetical protein